MALKSGAMITDDAGKKFNASKKKSAKLPPEPTPPPAPPEPKRMQKAEAPPKPPVPLNPTTADEGSKMVAESLNSMSKANVMMLAELKAQISAIRFDAAQPITDWEFDFIRDKNNYLTRITATAKTSKRTIN